jgi:N-acetylneuraminic acid mutarotase
MVLVVGGSRDGIPLASAELFDPRSGTWTNTAPMTVPRTDFAAVRLGDGQVMVIGGGTGKSATSVTTSVEIYNPDTRSWARTANTSSPRAYAAVAVLGDGSVLVAGGRSTYYGASGTVWATAERWDPNGRTWKPAGSMSARRYFGAAAALQDGSAVFAGGWPDTGNSAATASVDVYDLASGSWRSAGPMASRRAAFVMLTLADGRVIAVGGQTEGTSAPSTASSELFDPATKTWSGAGSLASPVWYPAAAVVPGGGVLVAGGALTADGGSSTAGAEVFTPP